MSVNIKLGEKTISGVDSIRVEDADTAGTYDVFSLPIGYTVSFSSNNSIIQQVSVPSGGTVNEPADPSAEGYSLVGWFTQANGGGSEVFFPYTPTADITLYAYIVEETFITFSSDEPFDFGVYNKTKNWDGTLYTSTDKVNWTTWDGTTDVSAAKHRSGYYLSLRGSSNTYIAGTSAAYNKYFVFNGISTRCDGNVENLLDYSTVSNGNHPTMGQYCYFNLFYHTPLSTAPKLKAVTLSNYCYASMFAGCVNLVAAPQLSATTLALHCYEGMFASCTSLISAPTLNATTATSYCYSNMFSNCSVLREAPNLPATTLAINCYYGMFQNCINLISAPSELPAETLFSQCYYSMFYGCSKLVTPPEIKATSAQPYGANQSECCRSMFQSCTSLTFLPKLSITSVTSNCFTNMFYFCSKIKLSTTQTGDYQTEYRIPTSGSGTDIASNGLANMFGGTGGTFTGTPTINTTYYTSNTVIPST